MRARWLGRRWLLWAIVVWGLVVAAAPRVEAAPLPPVGLAEGTDLERVRAVLEHRVVRARLEALGVAEAEAQRILERLTPEERSELAARADELAAGGNAAAVLAVAIVVAMLVILALELMGRRVISRP